MGESDHLPCLFYAHPRCPSKQSLKAKALAQRGAAKEPPPVHLHEPSQGPLLESKGLLLGRCDFLRVARPLRQLDPKRRLKCIRPKSQIANISLRHT